MSGRGGFEVYFWNSFREMLSDTDFTKKKIVHSPYSRKGNKILSGSIKQAQNAINEFTFVIPMQNNLYQKIIPFQSIVQVVNLYDEEVEFEGRVLSVSNKMTSTGFVQEVVCEDFLSFLHDSTQHYQKLKNTGAEAYLREILSQHNAQVEDYKRIYLGSVTVKSLTDKPWRYLGYESTWDTIRERIVANIGGYLTLRRENDGFYLDWASSIGKNQDSPIQLGRNIKSASREVSFDGIATQIMPIGADEKNSQNQSNDNEEEQGPDVTRKQIDISSVNGGKMWLEDAELVAKFGIIRKPVIWTEIDSPSVLKSRGLQYLRNQKIALAKWTVAAVERYLIDSRYVKFKIGNTHPILNAPLSGIERLQIIEKKIDVLNPQSVDLVIGSKSQSLSAYQLQSQEAIESIERVKANKDVESKREKLLTLTSELDRLRNERKPENTERIRALEAEIIKIRNELGGS
ncbi:phage tail protein [Streptococcus pneumoniae]|nr:phage tail protein [Streptococcus pneumoniae]MDG8893129.1 phage tail protein [Streptococcus pneumoniae]MDG9649138.1 phage tail protein [Streptococcus pneumoniae]VQD69576.1 putative membrane metallo-endo-peptidase [Streptococcus pneumoniae]VQD93375.1 putative membrane metallo-endo-peptidase [Streptococcus pneumoniae]